MIVSKDSFCFIYDPRESCWLLDSNAPWAKSMLWPDQFWSCFSQAIAACDKAIQSYQQQESTKKWRGQVIVSGDIASAPASSSMKAGLSLLPFVTDEEGGVLSESGLDPEVLMVKLWHQIDKRLAPARQQAKHFALEAEALFRWHWKAPEHFPSSVECSKSSSGLRARLKSLLSLRRHKQETVLVDICKDSHINYYATARSLSCHAGGETISEVLADIHTQLARYYGSSRQAAMPIFNYLTSVELEYVGEQQWRLVDSEIELKADQLMSLEEWTNVIASHMQHWLAEHGKPSLRYGDIKFLLHVGQGTASGN